MPQHVEAHIVIDWQFWVAVLSFVGPILGFILVVSWKFSSNIMKQLVILNENAASNEIFHARLETQLKDTCDSVILVNNEQWVKLVEHKVEQVRHDERLGVLEAKSKGHRSNHA